MRSIGFRSNLVFAIVAAIGVVASLGQPWYGPAHAHTDAQMEDLFNGIGRAFSGSGGTTGWVALQSADQLVAGLAVATVMLLLLTLVPAVQHQAQALARWVSLATLGVVVVKLVDEPGSNAISEPRYGVLMALAAALVLVGSTVTVAAAPARTRVARKTYTAPPPPY
jgi:hypothetical protein